jgi:hypothetical protein
VVRVAVVRVAVVRVAVVRVAVVRVAVVRVAVVRVAAPCGGGGGCRPIVQWKLPPYYVAEAAAL